MEQEIKTILFARWLALCYADTHIDNQYRCEQDQGFNQADSLSLLNRKDSFWYKEKLDYFNRVVYPNYIENKTVEEHLKQFKYENSI